ncbi:hypothetical protein KGO06_00620 [Patescibacteria group bacterium]|nr:hypothetical protein [Patescibacteria group bacterium]
MSAITAEGPAEGGAIAPIALFAGTFTLVLLAYAYNAGIIDDILQMSGTSDDIAGGRNNLPQTADCNINPGDPNVQEILWGRAEIGRVQARIDDLEKGIRIANEGRIGNYGDENEAWWEQKYNELVKQRNAEYKKLASLKQKYGHPCQ